MEESVRRKTLAALVLISLVSIGLLALAQQPTLHITVTQMPQQQRIEIIARSMQRDSASTHATGNVHVRITPIHPDEGRTVIHADEVIYQGAIGEIETRGDARITIEKAQ
jgi:lipopolysaccharide export system protein LptA